MLNINFIKNTIIELILHKYNSKTLDDTIKEITTHIPDEYINNKFELNFIDVDWPEHYINKY